MVTDEDAKTQTLEDVHFTGMSIVYKTKAAFEGTQFMCSMSEKESEIMIEKEWEEVLESAVDKKVTEAVARLKVELSQDLGAKKSDSEKCDGDAATMAAPFDLSKLAETITEAVRTGLETKRQGEPRVQKPERKTQQFASEARFKEEKTMTDLSKEIDEDETLTPEQKWAAQMRLWNSRETA